MNRLSFLIQFLVLAGIAMAQKTDGWTTFNNGALWLTPSGDTVQAHAPGFLYDGGRWWMVGEDRTPGRLADVNLYSSDDLRHWHFERKVITLPLPDVEESRMIERAKILRSPSTGQYIIWCHWEAPDYRASESASFVADSIIGPYTPVFRGRPMGIKARDCNVFVDNDGTAYFIATTNENRDLGLFRLSDDYTRAVSHTVLFPGERREAPVIVRIGDTYHMLTSACTGWAPNQCKYARSYSLTNGWTPLTPVGDATCYRTQPAAVVTIRGTKKITYLYVGDRWKGPTLFESKTIVFPITFPNDAPCRFQPADTFRVNLRTGEVNTNS